MAVSKVQFDGNTLIDLTQDTVVASKLHSGYTAHAADGSLITGSYTPPNVKVYKFSLSQDVSGQQYQVNPNGDSDIAAHRNDSSFVVGYIALSSTSLISLRAGLAANNSMHDNVSDVYGVYLRSSTSGTAGNRIPKPVGTAPDQIVGTIGVDSNGVINLFVSSAYPMRTGNYIAICAW